MTHNRYIAAVAGCLFRCVFAAADEYPLVDLRPVMLRIEDCFEQQREQVSGLERFYEPVILSKLYDEPIASSYALRKTLHVVVGFVEGEDQVVTARAADRIIEILRACGRDDFMGKEGKIDVNQSWLHSLYANGGPALYQKVQAIRTVLYAFQSSDDLRDPIVVYHNFGGIRRSFSLTSIAPPTVAEKSPLSWDDLAPQSGRPFHEAVYLIFNRERYSAFLRQLFDV